MWWYRWRQLCLILCLIERSSKLPRKYSEVFGNLRKILENVQKVSYALRTTLWKTSIGGQNSSGNRVRFIFWSWPLTRLLFTIVSRAQFFFMFRVLLEINLHLWDFFFEAVRAIFSFLKNSLVQITLYRMITYANNIIHDAWIFLLVLNK